MQMLPERLSTKRKRMYQNLTPVVLLESSTYGQEHTASIANTRITNYDTTLHQVASPGFEPIECRSWNRRANHLATEPQQTVLAVWRLVHIHCGNGNVMQISD